MRVIASSEKVKQARIIEKRERDAVIWYEMYEVRRKETNEEKRPAGMNLLKSVGELDKDVRDREKEEVVSDRILPVMKAHLERSWEFDNKWVEES